MWDSANLTLIGQVPLGLIFLVSAVNKLADPQGTQQYQLIHFLKNLSIMGGLLYVAQYGAGRFSMDAGLERAAAVEAPRRLRKVVRQ